MWNEAHASHRVSPSVLLPRHRPAAYVILQSALQPWCISAEREEEKDWGGAGAGGAGAL